MKEIQVKYKNNPEKLNQATMELYKSENKRDKKRRCNCMKKNIFLLNYLIFLFKDNGYYNSVQKQKNYCYKILNYIC